jgi:hypothetical protein
MQWFIASLMVIGLWLILRPKSATKAKPKNKYQTIEDIRRKYPKRKPIKIPSDGVYEDFSREVVPIESKTISLEISESSFKRLLELVGDRDKAIDGILLMMKAHPTKSATWACEKEISEIETIMDYRRKSDSKSPKRKRDRDKDRYL